MAIVIHPTAAHGRQPNYDLIFKIKENNLDVYIGNHETRQVKFDYILEVSNLEENYDSLEYSVKDILKLKFDDSRRYNIIQHALEITNFINSCKDGSLLIHCREGVSRSPSIFILYLIKQYNYTFEKALNLVSQKRKIKPNVGFKRQLRKFSITKKI